MASRDCTLEPAATRQFSLEGQTFAGPGRLFVPIKFCRHCGKDYYHAVRSRDGSRFMPHPVGTDTIEDGAQAAYLMLAPLENDWSDNLIPDEWHDRNGRLKQTWRDRVPQAVWVSPSGEFFTMPRDGSIKMWWQAGRFSLCLNCGEYYSGRELEFVKLASLSSEARTSATTVLATSLLRRAAGMEGGRDKLLTFTDNRQDASVQSGHFNDFIHVSLLRCALHAALLRDNELSFDRVAEAVVAASGLTVRTIAKNPELDPSSPAAADVMRAFVELTEYRIYEDLRWGWRVVQPNLENVGLLRVGYRGLETLCADNSHWQSPSGGRRPSPPATIRERLTRAFLDPSSAEANWPLPAGVCRRTNQQQIRRRSEQNLNEFWGVDETGGDLRTANRFVREGQSQRLAEGFSPRRPEQTRPLSVRRTGS